MTPSRPSHSTAWKLSQRGPCAGVGPLPRAGSPSPVPTLSRKRQGFNSKNTSVGGELWGPQVPQGGLVASKINLEVGTSCKRPEEDAGGSQTGPL